MLIELSKTICDTKFIDDFQGQIGQKGQKGHLFSPVFFPLGARGDLACKSCASSQESTVESTELAIDKRKFLLNRLYEK